MVDISIEEVNDIERFRSLKETWDSLLRKCPDDNVFLTWEWLFTWWQHFGHDKKLRIFLIMDGERIVGIAPFMQSAYRKGFVGIHVLENICAEECDYSGVIITEKQNESVTVLLHHLEKIIRDNKVILRMWQIPECSHFFTELLDNRSSFSESFSLDAEIASSCAYIELSPTWEEYLRSLNARTRYDRGRKLKALQKDYTVEFKNYSGGENLEEQLQVLFKLHENRWQEKRISSKFANAEARHFYIEVSKAFYQNNWLDLSFLNINGKPVAAHWGFIYNNTFHYMTPTFDTNYSRYGVGRIHLIKLVESSIQKGLKKFDFLKGIEAYKSDWTSYATSNYRITMTERSLMGRCRLLLLRLFVKYDNSRQRSFKDNFNLLISKIHVQRQTAESNDF